MKISVDKSKMKNFSSTMGMITKDLQIAQRNLHSLSNSLDWDVKAQANISKTMSNINKNMQKNINVMGKMSSFLQKANDQYLKLEREIAIDLKQSPINTVVSPGIKKGLWKFISFFGGSVPNAIFSISPIGFPLLLRDMAVRGGGDFRTLLSDISTKFLTKASLPLALYYLNKTKFASGINRTLRSVNFWSKQGGPNRNFLRRLVTSRVAPNLRSQAFRLAGLKQGVSKVLKGNAFTTGFFESWGTYSRLKESDFYSNYSGEERAGKIGEEIGVGVWNTALTTIGATLGGVGAGLLGIPSGPGAIATAAGGAALGGAAGSWIASKTENFARAVSGTVSEVGYRVVKTAENVRSAAVDVVKDVAKTTANAAKDVAATTVNAAKDVATTTVNAAKDVATTTVNAAKDVATTAVNTAKDVATTTVDVGKTAIRKVGEFSGAVGGEAMDFINGRTKALVKLFD